MPCRCGLRGHTNWPFFSVQYVIANQRMKLCGSIVLGPEWLQHNADAYLLAGRKRPGFSPCVIASSFSGTDCIHTKWLGQAFPAPVRPAIIASMNAKKVFLAWPVGAGKQLGQSIVEISKISVEWMAFLIPAIKDNETSNNLSSWSCSNNCFGHIGTEQSI